jgi:hypothetical protein
MKFLVTWTWKNEDIEKCWELFEKDTADIEWGKGILPQHLLVGNNKGFMVVDIDNMEKYYKAIDKWSELLNFEMHPILEAREMFKLRK